MHQPSAMHEFRAALRRRHTYDFRHNGYVIFGALWGSCFPVLFGLAHIYFSSGSIHLATVVSQYPHYRINYVLTAFVPLFSVVFGAFGTVLRDKDQRVANAIAHLDGEVAARTQQLTATHTQTVLALSRAIEAKDPYTAGHCYRVWKYAQRAAKNLGVGESEREVLRFACYLHDIGKIQIPGRILNKAGPLTEEERRVVALHPIYSQSIIAPIRSLDRVSQLVRHHHERNDGSGYPDGLHGDAIPLLLKILIVADTLDAMTSTRPYRRALSLPNATAELRRCAGLPFVAEDLVGTRRQPQQQLEPVVVEAILDQLQLLGAVTGPPADGSTSEAASSSLLPAGALALRGVG